LDAWAYRKGVTLSFSRRGKPTNNAYSESFNGKLRAEFLEAHWFEHLAGAIDLFGAGKDIVTVSPASRSVQPTQAA
jgi:transposase InsO family protein